MTLKEFGTVLRQRREEKSISLADISAYTRINQKFLEAIEAGAFSVLPQTYIRAFLKEYADAIDFPSATVLEEFEAITKKKHQGGPQPSKDQRPAPVPRQSDTPPGSHPLTPFVRALRPVVYGAIIVIIAGLMYFLMRTSAETAQTTGGEIPFDRVIRETEAALPADTVRTYVAPPSTPPQRQTVDSLVLEMTTTDSLWLSITIDNARNEEYLFAPNRVRTWKAGERFDLTMGNAGGATFRLNGKDLGSLGRRGAVLRNRIISADLLR
jgi:cytoskeletal protein RodZ